MAINHESRLTQFSFERSYRGRLKKYLSDVEGKTLLEIGAGYGHFARVAKQAQARVDALEPREECHSRLIEIGIADIEKCYLEQSTRTNKYDVCVAITVLDEVCDKRAFLTHLKNKIKASGLAFLEVRNVDYLKKLRRKTLKTDIPLQKYLSLFEEVGLMVEIQGGAPRPLSFGAPGVFFKTLLANLIHILLPPYHKQMLIFVLRNPAI